MNIKTTNILVFGIVGLIVLASWGITIWTAFNIFIAFPAMVLASCLCTGSYIGFINNSLWMQKIEKMENSYRIQKRRMEHGKEY